MADAITFDLGDVTLRSGAILKSAQITYATHGELNAAGDNAVVFPTHYTGRHDDNEWLIAEGMALDPRRYFVIVPNMFGNGLSTSPSRAAPDQGDFPPSCLGSRRRSSRSWSFSGGATPEQSATVRLASHLSLLPLDLPLDSHPSAPSADRRM